MNRSTVDIDRLAEIAIPSSGFVPPSGPSAASRLETVSNRVAGPAVPTTQSSQDPDLFDYGTDAIPDDASIARAFADLDRLTLQAERVTEQRKKAEEQLDKLKKAEDQLLNKDIPELLGKMRLDECVTVSGIQVKVKREIKASLPGHDRVEARMGAFRWLVENGHSGVIKNSVAVVLDRGEDARADDLVIELRAKGFDVESKKDVHAQTLGALVRELMADGKVVPNGTFNIFDMRLAKLSRK